MAAKSSRKINKGMNPPLCLAKGNRNTPQIRALSERLGQGDLTLGGQKRIL